MESNKKVVIAVIAGILLLAAVITTIIVTAEEQCATVQAVEWQREIRIERYKWVNESEWHLPDGAELRYIASEIHHYDTEYYTDYDGERRSRQEPVYRTKYYYEIERWRYERSVISSGDTIDAHWGGFSLEPKEREGSRLEQYSIQVMTPDSTTETFRIDYADWECVKLDHSVKVKRYIGGLYAYEGLLE